MLLAMRSITLVLLVAACGGKAGRPAHPELAAVYGNPAATDDVAPSVEPSPGPQPAAPAAKRDPYERLHEVAGPVPGLAARAISLEADRWRCGETAIVTTQIAGQPVAEADEPLAAVYELAFPAGLDFSAERPAAKDASTARIQQFLEDLTAVAGVARSSYEALATGGSDAQAKVTAMARLAQSYRRIASTLMRAEVPLDVRGGEFADDKRAAYCDTLATQGESFLDLADQVAAACAKVAADAKLAAGWWTAVCALPE